jgi:hypothetical protein
MVRAHRPSHGRCCYKRALRAVNRNRTRAARDVEERMAERMKRMANRMALSCPASACVVRAS